VLNSVKNIEESNVDNEFIGLEVVENENAEDFNEYSQEVKIPTEELITEEMPEKTNPAKCVQRYHNILLADGKKIPLYFRGWTLNNEYYIGGFDREKPYFCFIDGHSTGKIQEYSRVENQFVEGVSGDDIDPTTIQNLYQVLPAPIENKYIFVEGINDTIIFNEYHVNGLKISLYDFEEQFSEKLIDSSSVFWGYCQNFLPPEQVFWLGEKMIYVDCQSQHEDDNLIIDIEKKNFESLYTSCNSAVFETPFFSPDGKYVIYTIPRGQLVLSKTDDYLDYFEKCLSAEIDPRGWYGVIENASLLNYQINDFDRISNKPRIHWAQDSQSIYLSDFNLESDSYGDILKVNLFTGEEQILIDFDFIKTLGEDLSEDNYYFRVSPSEEFIFIEVDSQDQYIFDLNSIMEQ
jgi:hypothetical protein